MSLNYTTDAYCLKAWTTPTGIFTIHVYENAIKNPDAKVLRTWRVQAVDENSVDKAHVEAEAYYADLIGA